jgi:uncharacterized membrane protein
LGTSPGDAIINVLLHPWLPFTLFITIDRVYYIASLLRSSGFLALLAPEWLLPIAPSLAVNLLSNEFFQHSGVYHYNAAIIPFVLIAAIHGKRRILYVWYGWRGETETQELYREKNILTVAPKEKTTKSRSLSFPTLFGWKKLIHLARTIASKIEKWGQGITQKQAAKQVILRWKHIQKRWDLRVGDLARVVPCRKLVWYMVSWIIAMTALNYIIMVPLFNIFWADHTPGIREQRIEQLLAMIPPDAPVSASGSLNPHLTERQYITVFPELTVATMQSGITIPVEYVIVDLTNVSPEDKSRSTYFLAYLNGIQHSHQFRTIARADGVILLERIH